MQISADEFFSSDAHYYQIELTKLCMKDILMILLIGFCVN